MYYIICIALTFGVCWVVATPIVEELSQANVFEDLGNFFNSFFSSPQGSVRGINDILNTAWQVLTNNAQLKFNYIFFIVWLFVVFPFTLDLAQLALGEVLYGYMTSQVKYGFTGRFIKNIGKSCIYSLVRYFFMLILNAIQIALVVGIIKVASLGGFNIFLAILILALLVCFIAFKYTLVSCWMPSIAVLNCNVFRALKKNFKCVFRKFFNFFSNYLTLTISAVALNFMFCIFTFGVSLFVTLPLTAFVYVIFQMVSYFSSNGMRFYVYPDMFISPKKYEEQDKIKKIKYII
ncbi:MAG: hypothetical protein IJB10_05510 [Clostridia bacterium]|nr:hypothetical protein [Clostridia bacterium]